MKKNGKFRIMTVACSAALMLCACNSSTGEVTPTATPTAESSTSADYSNYITGKDISVEYSEEDLKDTWDSNSIEIALGDTITVDSSNVTVKDQIVTITKAGTYVVTGTLKNGQIIVDTKDTKSVHIILNGVSITNETGACLYVQNASKTVVTLAEGSDNSMTDGSEYTLAEDETEPDATIFSKDDLTFNGTGSLTITANYNDGIVSKDELRIVDGTINIKAKNNGIQGKDLLAIKDGSFTIEAENDGLKSTTTKDTTLGYIMVEGGKLSIQATGDGISAESSIRISGGTFDITAGGGYEARTKTHEDQMGQMNKQMRTSDTTTSDTTTSDTTISDTTTSDTPIETDTTTTDEVSTKGIKATNDIYIEDGTITVNSTDDSLHTNNSIEVIGGTITLSSGDDGIHSDSSLMIEQGTITVEHCYEGLESASITIADGTIQLTASDDGINAGGGADSSGTNGGRDQFDAADGSSIEIKGGTITVSADGDGIDSNGNVTMTGGKVLVNGPTNGGNGALDYAGTFELSGGELVAAGAQGMAQGVSTDSTQYSLYLNFTKTMSGNTTVSIKDKDGKEIISATPTKEFQNIVMSSPDFAKGETYTVYSGDTKLVEFTVSDSVTSIDDTGATVSTSQMGGGGGRGGFDNGNMTRPSGAPDGSEFSKENMTPPSGMPENMQQGSSQTTQE